MSGHAYRENLVTLVLDLASFERQRGYQLRVPIANVTAWQELRRVAAAVVVECSWLLNNG